MRIKEPINLKTESIGVILGDNSRVGSNSTTSPGTFIGKYTWIYPHTCVHGFIPELKKVYDKQNMVFAENEKKVLYKSYWLDWWQILNIIIMIYEDINNSL